MTNVDFGWQQFIDRWTEDKTSLWATIDGWPSVKLPLPGSRLVITRSVSRETVLRFGVLLPERCENAEEEAFCAA